jgi:hypothetical protein
MVKTRSKAKQQQATSGLPPKSPAFKSPPKTPLSRPRQRADIEESSAGSDTSFSSPSRGIAQYVVKQLAKDIEAGGGIKSFEKNSKGFNQALSNLCDQRQEAYGKRGDPLRIQIQKKVYRWQILDKEGRYDTKVLNLFQVKSFATLQAEQRQQKKQVARARANSEDSLSSSSSGSDSSSGSTTAAPSIRSQFQDIPFSPPPSVVEIEPPSVVEIEPPSVVEIEPPSVVELESTRHQAPIMSAARPRDPTSSSALPPGAGE